MNNISVDTLSPVSQAVKACIPARATYRLAAGAIALGLALSVATPVSADTFTVTNTNDSGPGSLREAIELANSNPGHDTINLSSVSGEITPLSSLGWINENVDIVGPGIDKLTISSSLGLGFVYGADVHISGLTANHVSAFSQNYHLSTADITLDNVNLTSFKMHVANANAIISNSRIAGSNDIGINVSYGHLTLENSEISGHTEGFKTSRIVNCDLCYYSYDNSVTLINSSVENNQRAGYVNHTSAAIIGSRISNNEMGLLVKGGAVTISNSSISSNKETGLFMQVGNIWWVTNGHQGSTYFRPWIPSAIIESSTISGNGQSGIYFSDSTENGREVLSPSTADNLSILNSTISDNADVGIHFESNGVLEITNSTIANNRSFGVVSKSIYGISGYTDIYSQERIYQTGIPTASFTNSIIAGNGPGGNQDISGDTPVKLSHSLIQNPGTTAYEELVSGSNLIGVDPLLAPLETNNGPIDNETPTHALLAGSPAIDAGDSQNCPATDQRGLSRLQGTRCDMGAFEYIEYYGGSSSMGDYVWQDLNGNGIQDRNESGLANVQVELRTCGGNNDTIVDTTTTDANGKYTFSGLLPSRLLSMRFIIPDGYQFSPEKRGSDILLDSNVNTATGRSACYSTGSGTTPKKRTAIDVGLIPTANAGNGVMGDTIWRDSNGDGIHNNNEPGLPFVNVDLLTCDGSILDSTTSDANGYYAFTQLTEGQYRMQFHVPTGFSSSPEKAGTNIQKDSNVNPATGLTLCYPMTDSQKRTAIDAGMVPDVTNDNINIVSAIYFTADQRLWIRAESDAQPQGAANITASMQVNGVEQPVGIIGWKPPKGYYQQVFDGITAVPATVTLTSDLGGASMKAVLVR